MIFALKIFGCTISAAGVGLLLALAAPTEAAAATTCPPLASKSVTATGAISTLSTIGVNVSGSLINFTQGGSKKGCVLVSFAAEASAAANETMVVVAVLDGDALACKPGNIYFVRSNSPFTDYAARAMNFVCPDVAPGSHSVRMQFLSYGGGTVSLDYRTTIVQYVP